MLFVNEYPLPDNYRAANLLTKLPKSHTGSKPAIFGRKNKKYL